MEILIDTKKYHDCTLGRLSLSEGNFQCMTLELPWLLNQKGISCIRPGTYPAKKYDSPKHGPVILLEDRHGRTFIEMHAGNFTRQILGCFLVGGGIKWLDADSIPDITNSKNTLKKLMALLPDEFDITIVRT